MPTKRRRVAVTLSDDLDVALTDLQDATGIAASAIISQIMEENIMVIRGIAEAAREAKSNPANAFQMMQRTMMEALQLASTTQLELMDASKEHAQKKRTRKPKVQG